MQRMHKYALICTVAALAIGSSLAYAEPTFYRTHAECGVLPPTATGSGGDRGACNACIDRNTDRQRFGYVLGLPGERCRVDPTFKK